MHFLNTSVKSIIIIIIIIINIRKNVSREKEPEYGTTTDGKLMPAGHAKRQLLILFRRMVL